MSDVYNPSTGEVIARVTSQTNTDANVKAGVMLRETLAANSRNARGREEQDRPVVDEMCRIVRKWAGPGTRGRP